MPYVLNCIIYKPPAGDQNIYLKYSETLRNII